MVVLGSKPVARRRCLCNPRSTEGAVSTEFSLNTSQVNGSLTSLDMERNDLQAEGERAIADALKVTKTAVRLRVR